MASNLRTKIRVFEAGVEIKCVPNANINFIHTIDQVKKNLGMALALKPGDPSYVVDEFSIKLSSDSGTTMFDINDENALTAFRDDLNKCKKGARVIATVHAHRPDGLVSTPQVVISACKPTTTARSISRGPTRPSEGADNSLGTTDATSARCSTISSGAKRTISPAAIRRTTTPNKSRSLSRGPSRVGLGGTASKLLADTSSCSSASVTSTTGTTSPVRAIAHGSGAAARSISRNRSRSGSNVRGSARDGVLSRSTTPNASSGRGRISSAQQQSFARRPVSLTRTAAASAEEVTQSTNAAVTTAKTSIALEQGSITAIHSNTSTSNSMSNSSSIASTAPSSTSSSTELYDGKVSTASAFVHQTMPGDKPPVDSVEANKLPQGQQQEKKKEACDDRNMAFINEIFDSNNREHVGQTWKDAPGDGDDADDDDDAADKLDGFKFSSPLSSKDLSSIKINIGGGSTIPFSGVVDGGDNRAKHGADDNDDDGDDGFASCQGSPSLVPGTAAYDAMARAALNGESSPVPTTVTSPTPTSSSTAANDQAGNGRTSTASAVSSSRRTSSFEAQQLSPDRVHTASSAAKCHRTPGKSSKSSKASSAAVTSSRKPFAVKSTDSLRTSSCCSNADDGVESSMGRNGLNRGLFPECHTYAEATVSYTQSLRSYGNSHSNSSHNHDGSNAGHSKSSKKSAGARSASSNAAARDGSLSPLRNPLNLSPFGNMMFSGEGRPSIGTMQRQWEFMCQNFVKNDPEELEWLMQSKAGGCLYARKKAEACEDKYFKSLHDIEKYQKKLELAQAKGGKMQQLVAKMAAQHEVLRVSTADPAATTALHTCFEQLQALIGSAKDGAKDGAGEGSSNPLAPFSKRTQDAVKALLETDPTKQTFVFRSSRKAKDADALLQPEMATLRTQLHAAQTSNEDSLKGMEKWARRERESNDHAEVVRREEAEWLAKHKEGNEKALATMRSFVPLNISEMTVADLMKAARDRGGLLSFELATELKQNKLLHWVVTHTDDIAMANFLSGDKKSYFENIESLDVIELRAIIQCLPAKFELDADGKKADWRSRFFARAKQVIGQQEGDKVKGGWDDQQRCRSMVQLPPLKPEQGRRAIYFFRTKEQSDAKLKFYTDKNALLEKKLKALAQAEVEEKEAQQEYQIVLEESRDLDMIEEVGEDVLLNAKDMAKAEKKRAEDKLKVCKREAEQLQRTINNLPISMQRFVEMEKDLQDYLRLHGCSHSAKDEGRTGGGEGGNDAAAVPALADGGGEFDWTVLGQAPVAIPAVFDPYPVVCKVQRAAAKFISAEEEAAQRRAELSELSSSRNLQGQLQLQAISSDDPDAESQVVCDSASLAAAITVASISDAVEATDSTTATTERGYDSSTWQDDGSCTKPRPVSMRRTMYCENAASAAERFKGASGSSSTDHTSTAAATGPGCEFTTPSKRRSVLSGVNPDLLNTLNKMLTSNTSTPAGGIVTGGGGDSRARARTPGRRGSMLASISSAKKPAAQGAGGADGINSAADGAADGDDQPRKPKASRSKLVKKLLGGSGNTSPKRMNPFGGGGGGRPGLSFLDQIKNAKAGAKKGIKQPSIADENNENNSQNTSNVPFSTSGSEVSGPTKRPHPFFGGGGGGGGGGAKPNFLDELKSKTASRE